jgi:hypothetical protein
LPWGCRADPAYPSGALPFAPDRETLPEDIALAYAKVLRAISDKPLSEQE